MPEEEICPILKEPIFDFNRRKELWNAGPLSDKFPVKFPSGESWVSFSGMCAGCGQAIRDDYMRGEVTEGFKNIYHVNAVGYCPTCELATCFRYLLKNDSACGKNEEGNWVTWRVPTPTFWHRLRQFIFGNNKRS